MDASCSKMARWAGRSWYLLSNDRATCSRPRRRGVPQQFERGHWAHAVAVSRRPLRGVGRYRQARRASWCVIPAARTLMPCASVMASGSGGIAPSPTQSNIGFSAPTIVHGVQFVTSFGVEPHCYVLCLFYREPALAVNALNPSSGTRYWQAGVTAIDFDSFEQPDDPG
jgi:hypothetical protein